MFLKLCWILLVFSLSVKFLIVQSNLIENLAVQCVIACMFFLFITLNILCHSLLACRVCSEKSRECQVVCLVDSCRLRRTLNSLSAGGWGCVPIMFVGLRFPSIGAYKLVLVRKWQLPRELMPMSTPRTTNISQCLCPPVLATRSGLVWYQDTDFFLGPGTHETSHAPSKNRVSFSPSLKSQILSRGSPPSDARLPGWGAWHESQNFHSCERTSMI